MVDETLDRWHKEGLPEDVHPRDFFGMDRCFEESYIQGAEFRFLPAFEEKILEEDANTQIVIDVTGTKLKRFKQNKVFQFHTFLNFL